MADNTNEVTTSFKVDISNLKAGITEANRQIRLANAEFKAASSAMDDWENSAEGITKKLESLSSVLGAEEKKLDSYKKQLELVAKEYGENSKQADDLKIKIANQEAAVNKTKKEIANYQNALENVGKETDDVNKKTEKAGDGFTVFKGVLADLAATAIKEVVSGLKDLASGVYNAWAAYDEGADTITAATGAIGEESEALMKVYKNVASSISADLGTVGKAVGEVATRFDASGEELEELSKAFLEFSEINGTDVKTSVDNVQTAMAAWGISAKDTALVLDLLNTAGQQTGVNVDSLAQSLSQNAPALQELGFSASDSALFLANLSKNGVDATATLTGLKKAMATASSAGIPFETAISNLEESIKNAETSTEAIILATDLFGTRAGVSIASAIKDGRLSFEELGTTLEDFNGNVSTTYNAMLDAPDEIALAIQNVKLEAAGLFDEILTTYAPMIKEFLGTVKDELLPGLTDTLKNDIIPAIESAITWVTDNKDIIISALGGIATALIALNVAKMISGVVKAFQAWQVATQGMTIAQAALNVVMSANPIGLVIAAVAGLVAAIVLLWNNSEEFRNFFINMWENIKNAASAAWEWIKNVWGTASTWYNEHIIEPVANFFKGMWDGLKNGAKTAWEGIKSTFSNVTNWFKDTFSKAWKAVKDVFSTGGKIFDGIKEGIVSAFKTVVNGIIRGINKVITIPFNGINSALKAIKDVEILGYKPFDWISEISTPQIPLLAKGGVLKRGQVGLLEGNGAEAVVPLENNRKWIRATAEALKLSLYDERLLNGASVSTNNTSTYNFYQTNNSPRALSRLDIYRQTQAQIALLKGVR